MRDQRPWAQDTHLLSLIIRISRFECQLCRPSEGWLSERPTQLTASTQRKTMLASSSDHRSLYHDDDGPDDDQNHEYSNQQQQQQEEEEQEEEEEEEKRDYYDDDQNAAVYQDSDVEAELGLEPFAEQYNDDTTTTNNNNNIDTAPADPASFNSKNNETISSFQSTTTTTTSSSSSSVIIESTTEVESPNAIHDFTYAPGDPYAASPADASTSISGGSGPVAAGGNQNNHGGLTITKSSDILPVPPSVQITDYVQHHVWQSSLAILLIVFLGGYCCCCRRRRARTPRGEYRAVAAEYTDFAFQDDDQLDPDDDAAYLSEDDHDTDDTELGHPSSNHKQAAPTPKPPPEEWTNGGKKYIELSTIRHYDKEDLELDEING